MKEITFRPLAVSATFPQLSHCSDTCAENPIDEFRPSRESGGSQDHVIYLRHARESGKTGPASATTPARGYDRSYLDTSVRPQDDFYQYAVGGYIKSHPIPDDRNSYGIRTELNQRVQNTLRDILEQAASNRSNKPASVEQKIGDFYASGMDTKSIEAAGMTPLQPVFDRIDAIQSRDDLVDTLAYLHTSGVGAGFGFGATQDAKNPTMMIGEATQGGLGLPERDYYLAEDKSPIREAYTQHVSKMFQLMGDAPEAADKQAQTVLSLETDLAKASMSRTDLRDPNRLYHIMDRAALAQLSPNLDWNRYFSAVGRSDVDKINVATPDFFKGLDQQIQQRPISDWKTYLRWQTINRTASYLSSPFENESFHFNGTVLTGTTQQSERWKKIVGLTDAYLGEALGQKFVEKAFPPEAKARAQEMVGHIRSVLRERITTLPWMGEESKKEALAKIDKLNVKIGYPDKWRDYSKLDVDRGPFINNIMRARQFEARQNLDSIGKPVDRSVWEMTPATVNAYYHPLLNEIVFPSARLQPPYFDPKADDAMNYGATGATIAHELTHGFDDSGSQFDSSGNLRDWWQPEDKARFKQIADGVEQQMSEFEYDGQKNNGKLVEGEALADQGGVELSYAALQRALAEKKASPTLDGFTPQQRFFLGYALCRESEERPQYAHLIMSTDPHPLGKFRVNGPLSNLPEFHQAFGCKPGDPMVRPIEKRNRLWGEPA